MIMLESTKIEGIKDLGCIHADCSSCNKEVLIRDDLGEEIYYVTFETGAYDSGAYTSYPVEILQALNYCKNLCCPSCGEYKVHLYGRDLDKLTKWALDYVKRTEKESDAFIRADNFHGANKPNIILSAKLIKLVTKKLKKECA